MADIDLVETDEHRALRETLREFFAEQSPLERLRRPGMVGELDRKTWAGVSELGLPALAVPEEYGGLGQGAREVAVACEEAGRGLYGGPLLSGLAATQVLLLSGDTAACAAHLPGIAEGTTVATVAVAEPGTDGRWTADAHGVRAEADGDAWTLSGDRTFVLAGMDADLILVPAATDDGPTVFAVDGDPEGLVRRELDTLDLSRPLSALELDAVPARPVGEPGGAAPVLDAALDRVLVALAAEQAGGAAACLDASVAYAKTRTQFEAPIGSFQAVAHLCVDMLARVERARACAQYAAAALATGSAESGVAARVAAAYCGPAFREVTTQTIHVHGGTGFTWEHDAHLFHRRAWTCEHLFGPADGRLLEVADRLGL